MDILGPNPPIQHIDGQRDKQTDWHTDRLAHRQIGTQTERQTDRLAHRQIDKQTDWHKQERTDSQTHSETAD